MQRIHTRHFFFGFTLMAIASFFLVVGIAGMVNHNFFLHFILTLCCVFALSFSEGTELDKSENRFRHYHSIFWVRLGEWRPLPIISHFSLVKNETLSRLDPARFKIIAVSLSENDAPLAVGHYKTETAASVDLVRLNKFLLSEN